MTVLQSRICQPFPPRFHYLLQLLISVGLLQPALQERLQFAHVLEAQLQGLEAADGGLAEHLALSEEETNTWGKLDQNLGENAGGVREGGIQTAQQLTKHEDTGHCV